MRGRNSERGKAGGYRLSEDDQRQRARKDGRLWDILPRWRAQRTLARDRQCRGV
ncbi:hypothetical protein [Klebsiella phage vB_KpnS-MUC-5]|nr:hypothetical protein [Klebsiella phage vB_KpnS-MUC-5]